MNPRSENWRAAGRVSDLIDFCPLGKFFFKDPGIFLDINQLHLFFRIVWIRYINNMPAKPKVDVEINAH